MITRKALPLAGLVATVTLAWAPAPATASHVKCGDALNRDTILDSDLVNCPGTGLVIGRKNITVDLDGHTVQGSRPNVGIDNSGGYDRVRIENGKVEGFRHGLLLRGVRRSTVEQVNVISEFEAIVLEDSNRNVVRRTEVNELLGGGVVLRRSHRNVVSDSHLRAGHPALVLSESNHNRISDNELQGDPIMSVGSSHDNLVQGNAATNGNHGIWIGASNRNTFQENTVAGLPFNGIELFSGRGNRLLWNEINGNLWGNGNSGVVVAAEAVDTFLRGNVATRYEANGFLVQSPSTTLRRNSATFNMHLGIDAVPGVRDGGGNRAFGNGDPRQCVNVSCVGAP